MSDDQTQHEFTTDPSTLTLPLEMREPRRFLVEDVFIPGNTFEFIDRAFAVMAICSQHTFHLLTDHPQRRAEYLKRIADDADDSGDLLWEALDEYEDRWPDWPVWFVRRGRGGLPFDVPLANVVLMPATEGGVA